MSKKQLGAVEGVENECEAGLSWFRRLRAQPGFRTATLVFALTVVLGIGSTAAYAYWSQTAQVQIAGTTVRPPLPLISGDVQCNQPFGVGVVRITHAKAIALPADASVVASVVGPGRQTRLFAVPNDGTFALRDLPGLGDSLSWGDRISISVTTAYLNGLPGTLPAVVDKSSVLLQATPESKSVNASYLASFFC